MTPQLQDDVNRESVDEVPTDFVPIDCKLARMDKRRAPPDELMTLAGRLKKARTDAKLSKVKLAKLVECSRPYIVALESGRTETPNADLALRLSDALGVPMRWLIRGDPLTAYARLSREEEFALTVYRRLPPALKKLYMDNVRSLSALAPSVGNPFPMAPSAKPPQR